MRRDRGVALPWRRSGLAGFCCQKRNAENAERRRERGEKQIGRQEAFLRVLRAPSAFSVLKLLPPADFVASLPVERCAHFGLRQAASLLAFESFLPA